MIGYDFYNEAYLEAYNDGYNDAIYDVIYNESYDDYYYDDDMYYESPPTYSGYDYNQYGSNRSDAVENSRYNHRPDNDPQWNSAIKFVKYISPKFGAEKISRQKIIAFYKKWKSKGSPTDLKRDKNVQNDLNKLQYNDLYRRSRVNTKDHDGYMYVPQGYRLDPTRRVGAKSSRNNRSWAAKDAKEAYDYEGYDQITRQGDEERAEAERNKKPKTDINISAKHKRKMSKMRREKKRDAEWKDAHMRAVNNSKSASNHSR